MIMSIFFISCSDDDSGFADPVIGKWQLQELNSSTELTNCQAKETLEFRADGKLIITQYESTTSVANENCDKVVVAEYAWSQKATNTYDIVEGSKTYTLFIAASRERLELRSNDLFIEEGQDITQVSKKYRPI